MAFPQDGGGAGDLVLVTGATGFIGAHVVREALEQGFSVRASVRNPGDQVKCAHLLEWQKQHPGKLDIVKLELHVDDGWAEALKGVVFVIHVASPVLTSIPKDIMVAHAVQGVERAIKAAADAGTVRRFVMTSSESAARAQKPTPSLITEKDWSDPQHCTPYELSKTLAERRAWEMMEQLPAEKKIELVTILPGLVLGPPASSNHAPTFEVVKRMLTNSMPGLPKWGEPIVDVRDIATAHVRALRAPDAAGRRILVGGPHHFMGELADVLREEFEPLGFKIPHRKLPYFLIWLASFVDKDLVICVNNWDHKFLFDQEGAKLLGLEPLIPMKKTLLDNAYAFLERGIVPDLRKKPSSESK